MNKKTLNNSPSLYADYGVNDFDKFDCLKLSKIIFLSLLFILRGYIVWIMSVTNMRDRVAIIEWLYPDPKLFYLSLVSGAFGLFLVLIISIRRPDAPNWVRISWINYRSIIITGLILDLAISAFGYFYWQLLSLIWLFSQTSIVSALSYFLFTSKRIKINLAEFPEKMPEN
ncbi:MAG: hypothetical protein COB35_07350 [Gammaproteobacteria bacterium]|nr:MAG: hypothetical protein COB35_07350 [Gammaproteobacteria bacterium]